MSPTAAIAASILVGGRVTALPLPPISQCLLFATVLVAMAYRAALETARQLPRGLCLRRPRLSSAPVGPIRPTPGAVVAPQPIPLGVGGCRRSSTLFAPTRPLRLSAADDGKRVAF